MNKQELAMKLGVNEATIKTTVQPFDGYDYTIYTAGNVNIFIPYHNDDEAPYQIQTQQGKREFNTYDELLATL